MATKNNYFSHDSNARNSDKIIKLRMSLGMEGYGIYFALLERLREEKDYKSKMDFEVLSFDLRVEKEKIRSVIEDFDLFIIDGDYFYSKSFIERMKIKDDIKNKRAEAGKKGAFSRWNENTENLENVENTEIDSKNIAEDSTVIANNGKLMAKNGKGKERKGKENIYSPTSREVELADYLFASIQRLNPKAKKPNIQNWAKEFDKILRIDARSPEDLKVMIDWIANDDFWSGNILSPSKLRSQFDRIYMLMIKRNRHAFKSESKEKVNEYGWVDM